MIKIASIALAVSLVASAASAQIVIDTTNLASPEGAARFERDLRKASTKLCSNYRGVQSSLCRTEVRNEALSQLPEQQRLAYLNANQNQVRYASAQRARG